jgi:NAD-dependent dihydropyrimidine dehydrogenase PreA subunit
VDNRAGAGYHTAFRPWAAAGQTKIPDPSLENDMPYVIAEPCIGTKDASCVEVCPVDCIYEANDQYYINPDECIDCGACEPECPVQAIFPDTDVPPEWSEYIEKNRVLSDG